MLEAISGLSAGILIGLVLGAAAMVFLAAFFSKPAEAKAEPAELDVDITQNVGVMGRVDHLHHTEPIRHLKNSEVELLASNTYRCHKRLAELQAKGEERKEQEAMGEELLRQAKDRRDREKASAMNHELIQLAMARPEQEKRETLSTFLPESQGSWKAGTDPYLPPASNANGDMLAACQR